MAQLADEFNQLTGRLQTTEEARRRFVSDASCRGRGWAPPPGSGWPPPGIRSGTRPSPAALNTYPILMAENMVFTSKQSNLKRQALVSKLPYVPIVALLAK